MDNNPLIKILSDYINQRQTAFDECDWQDLYKLSKQHEVTAIVYSQCKSFIPNEYEGVFESSYSATFFYYVNRIDLLAKIEKALTDIEHFIIKGAKIASIYSHPMYRTMGDIDIVVHPEDRNEVDRKLKELGLICTSSLENREWQYYFNDIEIELHDHLVYAETINKKRQEEYFNDFWKYVHNNELDWNFHFLFLIFHLRKHFMNGGVGIRHFMDIAILTISGTIIDWPWIENELRQLGLWIFTERVFALNDFWFGVSSPVIIDPVTTEFLFSATDLILKNGIFGFDNEDNKHNTIVNALRGRENYKWYMLRLAFRKILPRYENLHTVPQYSYIDGKPFLLPFAWVHRICRIITNKRLKDNVKVLSQDSFVNHDTLQNRESIYKQWGL